LHWQAAPSKGLIDTFEGNYGGDPTEMPYMVNKEAFEKQPPGGAL
jgi:hypothetical protein